MRFVSPILICILLCGCLENGLSVREAPAHDYAGIAAAFHVRAGNATPPKPLRLPIRLAVAQLGEVSPPQAMLNKLRSDRSAFLDVLPIPGPGGRSAAQAYYINRPETPDRADLQRKVFDEQAEEMRRSAQDSGADYLLVFGGTIDHAATKTPLSVLDLTIVGMFVVPGSRISAEGRAAGTVVEVSSGRPIFSVSAQRNGARLAPSATSDNGELSLVTKMRDDLTMDLANDLLKRIKNVGTTRETELSTR